MPEPTPENGPDQEQDLVARLRDYDRQQNAAWQVFTRQFDRENPVPPAPRAWQWLPFAMVPFAVLGLSGAFLSALRTAPVFAYIAQQFYGETGAAVSGAISSLEGLVATLVVDGAAVAFRFAMVVYNADGNAQKEISAWVNRGFYFAFASQVITNLYAVMDVATALPDAAKKVAEIAIMVVAALSGIIIAFATGDILGHQWLGSQSKRRELERAYQAAVAERDERRMAAWSRKKAKLGVREPGEVSALSARTRTDNADKDEGASARGRTARTDEGPGPAEQRAIAWLSEHPADRDLPVRQLADRIGVSKTVVADARRRVLSSNGHHRQDAKEDAS